MDLFKNKLQSNSKLDRDGNYLVVQTFNLPELHHYTQERAQEYLKTFDLTPRSIRQNLLNHSKNRLNYLSTILGRVHPITINLLKDNIALLEKTFEYIIWYQPNMNIKGSQITYDTDEEEQLTLTP